MNVPQPPNNQYVFGTNEFSLAWKAFFTALASFLGGLPLSGATLPNYVNDAAAAAGGVPVSGYYRNGSVVMQRIV